MGTGMPHGGDKRKRHSKYLCVQMLLPAMHPTIISSANLSLQLVAHAHINRHTTYAIGLGFFAHAAEERAAMLSYDT